MEGSAAAVMLGDIITAEMLAGVLDQVIDLLPVVVPVMITFIGIRKGLSFVQSMLHGA